MTDYKLTQEQEARFDEAFVTEDRRGRRYFQSRTHNPASVAERVKRHLAQEIQRAVEAARRDFENQDIEVELDTKQCLEIAKTVYEKYEEAMQPPVYAFYQFPDWLNRQIKLSTKTETTEEEREHQ